MPPKKPNVIEVQEVVIYSNEKDEPTPEVQGSDAAKQASRNLLTAASRRAEAAASQTVKKTESGSASTPTPTPSGVGEVVPADEKIDEKIIRSRLAKEPDNILQKLATSPEANRDPFAATTARIAREELNRRKQANSNSRPWYQFW
ncbi:hypothetical protein JXD20_03365 [Candidatus Peregrinibacteria bacterium]|nr:hypothetical protein [Candidatus Peregrinibacteria bacterium]